MQKKKDIAIENHDKCHVNSVDYRIKVDLDFFKNVEFTHLYSAAHAEPEDLRFQEGVLTAITGYTEWVSQISPVLSIGWDWELRYENANCQYVKIGPVFSNIAFHMDENLQNEMDEEEYVQQLLDSKIAEIEWSEKILQSITQ
ncbi:DUF4902 domain-containing protein [Budviciaceae bacterium BWR-B9]|uniref:DUF4902 domain-containing protein n=1 Tax=Limnobaculum allomyrinae TaxID=2791986 RepID=A0ABS1ILM7_9GAMM|nr:MULTISPECIES: DUF4902 domain-containing protein [Limnobaculum]MBK5142650.1 DUF4902 domain-containing protein [Limnobaculum allomyrinae]MBV7690464.1 DUF4902 domain-containing protein [Limnobaculum sp. M2-1]